MEELNEKVKHNRIIYEKYIQNFSINPVFRINLKLFLQTSEKHKTMKKSLLFLIALLLSLSTLGQSDYSRGFQNGYKVGYCYNDDGCLPPIPPITPMPRIGESQDNYQDGYNRGFKQGLEDKQAKKSGSSNKSEIQRDYSAPYPGGSSHDPIEFARRRAIERNFASQKQ